MSKQQNPGPKSTFYAEHKGTLESRYQLLEKPLTAQNYREKFHYLLCWEQQEHERQLTIGRCNSKPSFSVTILKGRYFPRNLQYESDENYPRFGYITCDDDDMLEYIKQFSEGSKIYLDEHSFVSAKHVRGSIPEVLSNAILVAFAKKDHEKLKAFRHYSEMQFHFSTQVEFKFQDFYFNHLHRSLDCLSTEILARLNPIMEELNSYRQEKGGEKVSIPPYNNLSLDELVQMKALYTILQSPPTLPVLVSGPFGTGKTRLLARAAYEILKKCDDNRVLICAHHQASVDTFLKYFGALMHHRKSWKINIIRLVPNESMKRQSELRREYSHLVKTKIELSFKDLKESQLVLTTFHTSAALYHILLHKGQQTSFFTTILMDEGAQVREPEAIIPLCVAGSRTQIVIAGDHCQVGPRSVVLGEKALSDGLGISLLERLYTLYGTSSNSKSAIVTLLINYRCHSGILMLPSSLYYHSTLQCAAKNSAPHHLAPFPLTFVCSDITEVEKRSGVNEKEASVLIDELKKYVNEWPKNWGKQDKVCIMSPSASQCTILRKKAKEIKSSVQIEVLNAYNIQGNEFRAVFVSTSEATTADGQPLNKARSLCDHYVFNTVLTRSQSLVVAVGNPFSLLKTEANMAKIHGKTWTSYIKQCLECGTFSYAKSIQTDHSSVVHTTHKLYDFVYSDSVFENDISKFKDTIVAEYRRMFESLRQAERARALMLRKPNKGPQKENEVKISESYFCTLIKETYRIAEAIPEDSTKQRVKIRGIHNLRGAFDGDRVLVEVFADSPPGEFHGRVRNESILIGERKNLRFVCQVSDYDTNIFYPIDGKNPKFYNLRILTKIVLKDYKNDTIVVFDPNSVDSQNGSQLPRITRVIPRSVALDMLFVVLFVKWEKAHPYPLGLVIDACRKGHTFYTAEHLLKLEYSVEYSPDDKEQSFANATDVESSTADLPSFDRAFTIDRARTRNRDDALSITKLSEDGDTVYQLGVHIVNATKHIVYGSKVDCDAREMGFTISGTKEGQVKHMLPDINTRRKLSLDMGKVRDVISVTCRATITGSHPISFDAVSISTARVKSAIQLTYEQAQDILDGTIPSQLQNTITQFNSHPTQISLQESVQLLYDIAMELRRKRMQSDAAYVHRPDKSSDVSCRQSCLLVEELMNWANNKVAKQLRSDYPDAALLRRHPSPKLFEEKRQEILKSQGSIMAYSLDLSQYLGSNGHQLNPGISIHITCDTLRQVHDALHNSDKNHLIHLLTSDMLYPQFAVGSSQFRSLSSRAEYCCAEERLSDDPSAYRHHDLRLNNYTHFTSPMRRYIDIEVQRMLLKERQFTHEQQSKLCRDLNKKKRRKKGFEDKAKRIHLASELLNETKSCIAFISKASDNNVKFDFPELELRHFSSKNKSLRIAKFFPSPTDSSLHEHTVTPDEKDPLLQRDQECFSHQVLRRSNFYMWKLRITSLKSKMAQEIIPAIPLSSLRASDDESQLMDKVNVFCLVNENFFDVKEFVSESSRHSLVAKIPASQWSEVLEFVKDPTEQKMKRVKEIMPSQVSPFSKSSPQSFEQPCPFLDCEVKSSLLQSDVFKLWLSWSMTDHWISSAIQLVEISPLLRICMQHNCYPARCFSHPNLAVASKDYYYDINEYIEVWKGVLLAEAAGKSVQDCQPVIIRDVTLDWPSLKIPETCIEEVYYVPADFITMILPAHFVEHCHEFFRVGVGDLVCVRYGCDSHQSIKAVYHLVVHHMKQPPVNRPEAIEFQEEPNEIRLYLEPVGEMNCRISERMKSILESEKITCEVQLIQLGYSYSKVFRGLVALSSKYVSNLDLSKPVATEPERIRQRGRFVPSSLSINVATEPERIRQRKVQYSYRSAARIIAREDKLAQSISYWTTNTDTTRLNEYQERALYKAIENNFQLIQGPPGSGKSVTGARIAYVFAQTNKKIPNCVLYCGPSNKSVDVVFEKFVNLLDAREELKLNILRIYSSGIERQDFPGARHYNVTQRSYTKCHDWAKPYALHHLLRQDKNSELVILEKHLNRMKQEGKIPTARLCYKYRYVLLAAEEEFFKDKKFDIVFCTCNEASGGRIKRYKSLTPCQCIIDECGMAYEPETIVPISLCEHVVLIGDHQQLQPVIAYKGARDCGLTTSLFERYAKYHDEFLDTLQIQYRMHMAICSFPSEEFYSNLLRADESVLQREANPELNSFWPLGNGAPIMFVDVVGKEETGVGVESKYNMDEAKLVIEIARKLISNHGIKPKEIAVLSPYIAQKIKISEMCHDIDTLKRLRVATITESQGDEYGIVILSTVRSQPLDEIRNPEYMEHDQFWMREHLGFITDRHQINVGITRSKYGLVITGNKTLLEYDGTWRKLLKHYSDRKSVVDASRFIS